jgi:hypothetical protein
VLKWLAARRRERRELELVKASSVTRALFRDPIAFVAEEWVRVEAHMLAVSAEVWTAQSLERRFLAFEGLSPAIHEVEKRFSIVSEKIEESASKTGASIEEARDHILKGIFAEAVVSAGEKPREVYGTLFPR